MADNSERLDQPLRSRSYYQPSQPQFAASSLCARKQTSLQAPNSPYQLWHLNLRQSSTASSFSDDQQYLNGRIKSCSSPSSVMDLGAEVGIQPTTGVGAPSEHEAHAPDDEQLAPNSTQSSSILNYFMLDEPLSPTYGFGGGHRAPSDLSYGRDFPGDYPPSLPSLDASQSPEAIKDDDSSEDDAPMESHDSILASGQDSTPKAYGSKPYAILIYDALMEAPGHRMVLQDIYNWFRDNTDKVKAGGSSKGWQNSIRHNLSMNEAFVKMDHGTSRDGKRTFLWALHPSAIGKGHVESTTRYRKNVPGKRSARHSDREDSHSNSVANVRPQTRRHRRKRSIRSTVCTSESTGHLKPSPLQPCTDPVTPTALPAHELSSWDSQATGNLHDHVPPLVYQDMHQDLTNCGFGGQFEEIVGSENHKGDAQAESEYGGFPLTPPHPVWSSLPMDGSVLPYPAFDPPAWDPFVVPQHVPRPLIQLSDATECFMDDLDGPIFVAEHPSALEVILLDGGHCSPGHHALDCWAEFCRY